jgi:RNA polymerase sigma-70 factor, ECF subfamily
MRPDGASRCYRQDTHGNGLVPLLADGARATRFAHGCGDAGGGVVREEELGDLFKRYAPYVATIGIRLLGRDDELDDLVQEVFIEAYRGFQQLRRPDAVKAWLARITVRRAVRRLRRRRLRSFFSLEALPSDAKLVDDGATPEEKAEIASTYRMVERIPIRQRVVWVLKHVEGETLDSIATICHISKATVQRRLRAAERALRMLKERQGDPDGRLRS